MKKIISLFVFLHLFPSLEAQTDAVFDSSFGANGIAQFTNIVSTSSFNPLAFVIQNDSKIVVVAAEGATPVVARMNVDGTIDTGFGISGKVTISGGTSLGTNTNSMAIALDRQQNIIVGWYSPGNLFQLFALNPSGTLLSGFAQGTVIGIPAVSRFAAFPTIAIAENGSIYLGLRMTSNNNALVVKLTSFGSLDLSFNANSTPGYANFPGADRSALVTLTDDQRLRVASYLTASSLFCVFGLLSDGEPDTSFGISGLSLVLPTVPLSAINAIKILHDGRIVLGEDSGRNLYCLTPEGFMDISFGNNGVTLLPGNASGADSRYWISVRSNGSIDCILRRSAGFVVLRVSDSGHIENDFDFTPMSFFNFSSQAEIDADGNFIVVARSIVAGFPIRVVKFKMESLRYSRLSKALWRRYYNRV